MKIEKLLLSALDWWQEAGADIVVGHTQHDWLAPSAPPAAKAVAPAEPTVALPADLATFRQWLLTDTSVPGSPGARLDAAGDPASCVMILVDMPDAGDRPARALLSGEVGALFDRMLTAMGLARDTIYLAAFSPARPASGRLDAEACRTLAGLARHHIALAAPKRLLLLGDAPVRALTDQALLAVRGQMLEINHPGGSVPAVASFHPRYIREQPTHRAEAWADFQRFMALA